MGSKRFALSPTTRFLWTLAFLALLVVVSSSFVSLVRPRTAQRLRRPFLTEIIHQTKIFTTMSDCFDESTIAPAGMDRLVSFLKNEGIQYRIVVSSGQAQENVTAVKTLVWEALPKEGMQLLEPHYFVTALEASQRVDMQALKLQIQGNESSDIELQLVETATAERLTGFVTGTIPPFAHVVPKMSLCMDPSLMSLKADTVSVGSGAAGYDLLLSVADMKRLCEKTARVKMCVIAKDDGSRNNQARSKDDFARESAQRQSNKVTMQPISSAPANKPQKPLSKRLRDAAGKRGKSQLVKELIKEAGDSYPQLMGLGADGNFTKNSLHLAAWKGDLESIRLLAEAGNWFDLDLVNLVSTGEGNYGKTPIFYSMTQCRDDAVKLLVELGANLLIVNNKGQTPCSMAPSHLEQSTCEFLYKMEAKQLREGGTFVNYRTSHSDGKRYGDLDPRFPIDDDNMDADIAEELAVYRQVLGLVNGDKPAEYPTGLGFPRSIRQTTRETREAKALGYRTTSAKAAAPQSICVHTVREYGDHGDAQEPRKKSRKRRNALQTPTAVIDVTNLDCLRLKDVLPSEPILVQDYDGIRLLAEHINVAINADIPSTSSRDYPSDSSIAQSCWGLDCEWRPARDKGQDNPVATLQLSTSGTAFLVDLQSVCQPQVKTLDCHMTEAERSLSEALTRLFTEESISISGFGIGQDLSKLAASFPHLPCFRLYESVIDVQLLSRNAFPGARKDYINSLQKAVAVLMSKRLDKTEQCSDWQQRPLSPPQIEYAVLDAVLSRTLVSMVIDRITEVEPWRDEFFKKHSHLRHTVRLQHLDSTQNEETVTPMAYRVSMGAVKQILSLRFAKQTWPTGRHAPPVPELIPLSEVVQPPRNGKRRSGKRDDGSESSTSRTSRKGKGISLSTLPADQEGLPPAGAYLGWTKDSCVNRMLGKQVLNSIPSDYRLRYNRWGGVIEMANSWLLFINFKGQGNDWKYQNEFSNDGRQITFSINPKRPQEHAMLEFLENDLDAKEDKDDKKIFLFARPSSREKFLFCGECRCVKRSFVAEDVHLQLELLDYEMLAREGGPYEQLIMKHHDDSQ